MPTVHHRDATVSAAAGVPTRKPRPAAGGLGTQQPDLLGATIDPVGANAVGRRFRLALAWIATGTLLGAWLPILGLAVIAAFIPFYWLPIRGETARAK